MANIGNLVEPVTRASYDDGSARLPPQNFAHNMATKAAQSLHAQEGASKGVLGRMLDAMAEHADNFRTGAFSIAGNAKIVEAEKVAPDIISASGGAVRFVPAVRSGDAPCELCEQIDAVLRPTSTSAFGETIASLTASALGRSEEVGDLSP